MRIGLEIRKLEYLKGNIKYFPCISHFYKRFIQSLIENLYLKIGSYNWKYSIIYVFDTIILVDSLIHHSSVARNSVQWNVSIKFKFTQNEWMHKNKNIFLLCVKFASSLYHISHNNAMMLVIRRLINKSNASSFCNPIHKEVSINVLMRWHLFYRKRSSYLSCFVYWFLGKCI